MLVARPRAWEHLRWYVSLFNKDIDNRPVKRVPVAVADLRELRYFAERLTAAIHSNGSISKDDKIAMFGRLSKMKKTLEKYIQLELFSDAQLEQ